MAASTSCLVIGCHDRAGEAAPRGSTCPRTLYPIALYILGTNADEASVYCDIATSVNHSQRRIEAPPYYLA